MPYKITIATHIGFTNRGAEALLRTRIEAIRLLIPNAEFYVLTIYKDSCAPIEGTEYIQTFGGQREKLKSPQYLVSSLLQAAIWTFEIIRFRYFGSTFLSDLRKITESDVFISTDGDVLGEDYGLFPYVWRLYYLAIGLLLGKPVVIYSEGVGPFYSKIAHVLSRLFFNRCAYISVRDVESRDHLRKLGVRQPIELTADSAFLLEPAKVPGLKNSRNLIGIAVSKLATQYGFRYAGIEDSYEGFLVFMGKSVDWLVETYDADVALIPHVVQIGRDDFKTANDILKHVENKHRVTVVSEKFNASELKGIISQCSAVIASRMHAAIAAVSSGLPVIGIAYSHKMNGVLSMVKTKHIIDIRSLNESVLHEAIKDVMENQSRHRDLIFSHLDDVKKSAMRPAIAVAKLLGVNNHSAYTYDGEVHSEQGE